MPRLRPYQRRTILAAGCAAAALTVLTAVGLSTAQATGPGKPAPDRDGAARAEVAQPSRAKPAAAAAALAGTVYARAEGAHHHYTYAAAPGVANDLTVTRPGLLTVEFHDSAGAIETGGFSFCRAVDTSTVRCEFTSLITVLLGDRDDHLESTYDLDDTGPLEFDGGAGKDTIVSTGPADEVINAGPDNDTVLAGAGNDQIDGGAGADTINGQAGDDTVHAGAGGDTVNGGDGHDKIFDEADNDTVFGDAGSDRLYAGTGQDDIHGGADRDRVSYENDHAAGVAVRLDDVANDGVSGERDNVRSDVENIVGTAFGDVLQGSAADNGLWGELGNDHLIGLGGDDMLDAWVGSARIDGGAGTDSCSPQGSITTQRGSLPGVTKISCENSSAGMP